jgi:hypothetical protein
VAEALVVVLALSLLLLIAAPEERVTVEAGIAVEDVYPPRQKETKAHPTYGVAVSATVRGEGMFKAMLGLEYAHLVNGWLGDPETDEIGADGTVPTSFRGQLFRISPLIRLGLEKDWAYGYFGLAPGYALRIADLRCARAPCTGGQAIDHGLNLALSLGALAAPFDGVGFMFGAEVGLDWAFFPAGHALLATWNQGMSARAVIAYGF